jgi:uncharacterized protein
MNDTVQPPVMSPDESNARMWNMLCHLSALAGLFFPFGNLLGPLIVWQIKKNEIPSVDEHGKQALNFQLTVAIAAFALAIVGFITAFICIGYVVLLAAGAVAVAGIVLSVIAGINANNGKPIKYPYTLTLIK